jgi:hypothetical protein
VVEGARLESEYTSKAYPGFESLPLRQFVFSDSYPPRPRDALGAIALFRRWELAPLTAAQISFSGCEHRVAG